RHDVRRFRRRIHVAHELPPHACRNLDLGQRLQQAPGLAVAGPLLAAGGALLDVLVRGLAPGRVERLGQQHRHALAHQSAVRHRSPPLPSPASVFFSVSMARNTRVFTAPSEHPEICAISAYDSPWYRESRMASRWSGVRTASAFWLRTSFSRCSSLW